MNHAWATLNAGLNALSALCLGLGYVAVRRHAIGWHRACMTAAFAVSTLFFVSYVAYHVRVGSVRFMGQGWIRPVYFALLISHVLLAMAIVPLAIRTLALAVGQRIEAHRRLARITWPIWMYVSLSGVAVYVMLYKLG